MVDPALKADLLAASTVLAHPSWVEPFGLAMLEAMTASKAVVAASTDGSRYLVEPGVTGVLVPPREPAQLAAALIELLEDPDLARRMGTAGRERAQRISNGRMVERIVEVWEAAGST
jgi:type III pantothenate kinase